MWASNITVMSPGKPMAISNYPFPAVTICSESKFSSSLLNFTEAYHTYSNNETRDSLSEDEWVLSPQDYQLTLHESYYL